MLTQNQAANIIVNAFRKLRADRSIQTMFRTGSEWQDISLEDGSGLSLSPSLSFIDNNWNEILSVKSTLSVKEKKFFYTCMSKNFYALHITNAPKDKLVDSSYNLRMYSQDTLNKKGIPYTDNSSGDVFLFGTSDFIFYSIECGESLQKKSSRFGKNAYRISFDSPQFRHAIFYMVDPVSWADHNTSINFLSQESNAVIDEYSQTAFTTGYCPKLWKCTFYSRTKFLESMFLHIIRLIRTLPENDRELLISCAHNDVLINTIINKVFRPQILIPKMAIFKQSDYKYFKL